MLGRGCVLVTFAINLDKAEHLDTTIVSILCHVVVMVHVRWDASMVVLVVTGHGDLGIASVLVLDFDTHLVLAVVVKVLVDVLDSGLLVGEELTGGVGVPFKEATDGVDYCILFHCFDFLAHSLSCMIATWTWFALTFGVDSTFAAISRTASGMYSAQAFRSCKYLPWWKSFRYKIDAPTGLRRSVLFIPFGFIQGAPMRHALLF
jgi:hypothetical protein